MKILITGANGFIGNYLSNSLEKEGFDIVRTCRKLDDKKYINIGEIDNATDWSEVLVGIDLVIHLAGRAHKPKKNSKAEFDRYLNTNSYGTLNLARQCVLYGVKNFIYFSSIKVNGEKSKSNFKFNESNKPNPQDIYGKSKLKAEKLLIKLSKTNNLNLKIVRIPIVYGPNVKGNFLSLLKIVRKGFPLPFRGFRNKRSMIFIGNLNDFTLELIKYKSSKPEIFLVSDGEDISTFELIRKLRKLMKSSCFQFAFPTNILSLIFLIIGKRNQFSKISDPLEIDISKSKKILKWKPKYSIQNGLEITCNWYLSGYYK